MGRAGVESDIIHRVNRAPQMGGSHDAVTIPHDRSAIATTREWHHRADSIAIATTRRVADGTTRTRAVLSIVPAILAAETTGAAIARLVRTAVTSTAPGSLSSRAVALSTSVRAMEASASGSVVRRFRSSSHRLSTFALTSASD